MNFPDFTTAIKFLEEEIKTGAGFLSSKIDKMTYAALINCLKSTDAIAVKTAIDQLASEKRPLAIPPLYLVSVAHPNEWVRRQAKVGLSKLILPTDLTKVTEDKDTKEAVMALIDKYGHFRA